MFNHSLLYNHIAYVLEPIKTNKIVKDVHYNKTYGIWASNNQHRIADIIYNNTCVNQLTMKGW